MPVAGWKHHPQAQHHSLWISLATTSTMNFLVIFSTLVAAAMAKPGFLGAPAFAPAVAYGGPINIPTIVNGFVDDTPDVKAARAAHFDAHAQATGRALATGAIVTGPIAAPLAVARYGGPIHIPTIVGGYVDDTPDVKANRAAHLDAHVQANARNYGVAGVGVGPALAGYAGPLGYAGPIPAVVNGFVDETPEVKAVKAAHFNAHLEAKARNGIIFG